MMKKLFAILPLLLVLISCAGDKDHTVEITKSSITAASYGEVVSLEFESSHNWKVVLDEEYSWITLSQSSGKAGKQKVDIDTQENLSENDRIATGSVKTDKISKAFTITQKGKGVAEEYKIELSETEKSVPFAASSFKVNVITKNQWDTKDIPAWITLEPTSGTGNVAVTVTYQENESNQARFANIVFFAGTASETLVIEQGANDEVIDEKAALMAIYDAMDGANWKNKDNWGTDAPLSTWKGITTDKEGKVTELFLPNNKLKGTLPAELGDLRELVKISLGYNSITGNFPPEIGKLKKLQEIEINKSAMTGALPAEIGDCISLKRIHLPNNQIEGPLPKELGKLLNLEWLNFLNNKVTGTIPVEIKNLVNLTFLSFSTNQMTGSIPSEIGSLINLKSLYFDINNFTGSIPKELGNLTNLEWLYLSDNPELGGTLPVEICNLNKLEALRCQNTSVGGDIPTEIIGMKSLSILGLYNSKFTGSIPAEIGKMNALKYVYLNDNQLSGTLPTSFDEFSPIITFIVDNNNIEGTLPESFADCYYLGSSGGAAGLSCAGNRLTGVIPESYKQHYYYSKWVLEPQQEGYGFQEPDAMELSTESVNADRFEGTESVNVTTTNEWSVTNVSDWVTVTPMSGSGDASVQVTYAKNNYSSQRVADIIFNDGVTQRTLKVTQAPSQVGDLEEEEL